MTLTTRVKDEKEKTLYRESSISEFRDFIHANDHFVQSERNDLVVSDNLATFACKFSE